MKSQKGEQYNVSELTSLMRLRGKQRMSRKMSQLTEIANDE